VAELSVAAVDTCDDVRWLFDFQNMFWQSVTYLETVVTISRGCSDLHNTDKGELIT